MDVPRVLDDKNILIPNLDDIVESATRTFGQAEEFYMKETLYLQWIEKQLNDKPLSEEQIYDISNTSASGLAECCEMYLKALYLYENKDSGKTCEELWSILEAKHNEQKSVTDRYGHQIYVQMENDNITEKKYPDGTPVHVYAVVDENGELVLDENGNPKYIDKLGNEYDYNRKGKAVKTNGHALDRLVELMSPMSRSHLELKMLTIPMDQTDMNGKVTFFDVLLQKQIVQMDQHYTKEQYESWLYQHKRVFEQCRFSGQKQYDVSVEFLYHFMTQIRSVVQYTMQPTNDQIFDASDEQLKNLPESISRLAKRNKSYLSNELVKLISSDEMIKNKVGDVADKNYVILMDGIGSSQFHNMIVNLSVAEIALVSYLNYQTSSQNKDLKITIDENSEKKLNAIISWLKANNITGNKVVKLFILIKELFHKEIDADILDLLYETLDYNNLYDIYNNKDYKMPNYFDNDIADKYMNYKKDYINNNYIHYYDDPYKHIYTLDEDTNNEDRIMKLKIKAEKIMEEIEKIQDSINRGEFSGSILDIKNKMLISLKKELEIIRSQLSDMGDSGGGQR